MRGSGCEMLNSSCVQSAGGGGHMSLIGGGVGGVGSVGGVGVGFETAPHVLEAQAPATAALWSHTPNNQLVKQEHLDHDSSAYGSGSDGFHSSSPAGSDISRDSNPSIMIPYSKAHLNNNILPHFYSSPISNLISNALPYQNHSLTNVSGFNPLTPPGFEAVSPKIQNPVNDYPQIERDSNTTLTPCHTPPNEETPPKSPKNSSPSEVEESEDHLRRLQIAFEQNGMLPTSPKETASRDSGDEDTKSDFDMDELDGEGLRVPSINSHGKVKTFKCKQCEFVAVTKLAFWEHSRGHIKAEKLLTCPKCPFVTEYKHHLEYHLRNHFGSKPFKCDQCSYSCVNKSMLNSHLKSHSNVYQYNCADCKYATKYCHSLKLHLRKYKHKPAMVLNPDGTPNPFPIIDVYGTRRGPKVKKEPEVNSPPVTSPMNNFTPPPIFPPFVLQNSPQTGMPLPFPYGPLLSAFGNPLLFPQMNSEQVSPSSSNDRSTPDSLKIDEDSPEKCDSSNKENIEEKSEDTTPNFEDNSAALDLSKPETNLPTSVPNIYMQTPVAISAFPSKNRRKGRAYKLDRMSLDKEESSDEEKDIKQEIVPKVPNKEIKEEEPAVPKTTEPVLDSNLNTFNCQFCDIVFRDVVMYTMHMGYHGFNDPFTCNMCGTQCSDKVSFFLHIARTSHS